MKHRLAIFASGGGSNALKIIEYFQKSDAIKVALIVTNHAHAGVTLHAATHQIDLHILEPGSSGKQPFLDVLKKKGITAIILAGYLKKIPPALIRQYPDRIINIHPALLPAYGGKGMYGHFVHEAVVSAGETQSGMTIHLVNEKYDEGRPLFQAICPVFPDDNAELLAARVLTLEHRYFAPVIERYLLSVEA